MCLLGVFKFLYFLLVTTAPLKLHAGQYFLIAILRKKNIILYELEKIKILSIRMLTRYTLRGKRENQRAAIWTRRPRNWMSPVNGWQCNLAKMVQGVQGWRSGESTRLPPMWPGFDSQTRRHGLSLLVLYSAPRGFSPVFPSPQKPKFDLICVNLLISIYSVPD